jgi:hypothetical protein
VNRKRAAVPEPCNYYYFPLPPGNDLHTDNKDDEPILHTTLNDIETCTDPNGIEKIFLLWEKHSTIEGDVAENDAALRRCSVCDQKVAS